MADIRGYRGPLPHPDFRRQVADEVFPPYQDVISGEVTLRTNRTLGIARFNGRIKNVFASCQKSGKKDSATPPYMDANVEIAGVSVLSTKVKIAHVSGEASVSKTSFPEAEDTGITQPVIDEDVNLFAPGDILTWTCTYYSGESAPTSHLKAPGIIVEVEPLG